MPQLTDVNAALIFGTDTGNTEEVGEKIAEALAGLGCPVEMINVSEASASVLKTFDFMIMGIPTWDFGGIQADWEEFESELTTDALFGKPIALYGLGDQFGYGDFFLDAMGWLHDHLTAAGAQIIGAWPINGYDFNDSRALNAERTHFCGLAVDEDQQFELTDQRVEDWVNQIADEITEL